MATIFMTGFPGFLGGALLPRLLARDEGARAVCLIQPKFALMARRQLAHLTTEHPELAGRVQLVEGDITQPGLGLDDPSLLQRETTEIYHLAAIYDLAVPREPALRVNVEGTRQVCELAARCAKLEHLHYVSTCYVSGRHAGIYREEDLDKGQSFNNFYEESKFLAECVVQRQKELPTTIYRPAIVMGDSQSGATQKYDGPYAVLRWLLRQPRVALMPVVGDPSATCVNVVPCDFVVEALTYLSGLPHSLGKVYHLADPAPLTPDAILTEMARATGRRIIRLPLPLRLAKAAINHVPGVAQLLQIPAPSIDYFVHPTHYATSNTQHDLAGSGISVPALPSYLDRLVSFMRAHPDVSKAALW